MPTLYEITHDLQTIFNQLEENGGELTAELQQELDSLNLTLEDKIQGYCFRIKDLQGDIEKFKAEEARLVQRRKCMEKQVEALQERMKENLKSVGLTTLEAGVFKVRIQKNAPSVVVDDLASIPEPFKWASLAKIAVTELPDSLRPLAQIGVDKTELAKRIKAGEIIPGVHLEQSESVRIA